LAPPEIHLSIDQMRPLNFLADVTPLPVMPQLEPSPKPVYEGGIPASLRSNPLAPRDTSRPSPSWLASLEPVDVAEDMSERLLVQKVMPIYPDQALRTGLQGTVVLQALIGKDGLVRDLKLIHGSLLLGQAAFDAVRQWRYQPYFVNGHAVDAQTQVTVEFKLPAVAQAAAPKQ
jgi:protein TonB